MSEAHRGALLCLVEESRIKKLFSPVFRSSSTSHSPADKMLDFELQLFMNVICLGDILEEHINVHLLGNE